MTEGSGAAPRPGEAATWGEPVRPTSAPAPVGSAPTDKAAGAQPRRSARRADKAAATTRGAGADPSGPGPTPGHSPTPTPAPAGRRAPARANAAGRNTAGVTAPGPGPARAKPSGRNAGAEAPGPSPARAASPGRSPAATDTTGWSPAATDNTGWSPAATDTAGWSPAAPTRTRPPLRPEGRPPRRAPSARDRAQHLRPETPAPAETIRVRWRDRRRVRLVEHFTGRGVRAKTGWWRRLRSIVLLLVIGAILAGVVAAILAAAVAGIALGLHHLSKG
jgi:hypothetical protein